jgi:DNA-binding protein Fis
MAEYRSHDAYLQAIAVQRTKRAEEIRSVVREKLGKYVAQVEADELDLGRVSAEELRELLSAHPDLLKPLLVACNVGQRAVKRDLGFNVNTLRPRLKQAQAQQLAEFLLRSLPKKILVDSLVALDLYQWTDSAIRKAKGGWEKNIIEGLKGRGVDCRKRKFKVDGQSFELDVAYPSTGPVKVGVDVKMIGHALDIHKRSDEIKDKATLLKEQFPEATFVSVVYYPDDEGKQQVENRLRAGVTHIDRILFAGDDPASIAAVVDAVEEVCRSSR